MQGKIGLEEHFAIPETLSDSKGFLGDAVWPELEKRLLDIQDYRLRQMDQNGMELMLLSLNAPAVQALPDSTRASAIARRANDFLAGEVQKRPRRFQGLAALAMQDPDGATRELVRCVKELGFRGALVNGFSQIKEKDSMVYLDDGRYRDFWAECGADLRGPSVAPGADLGFRPGNRGARAKADGVGPVRRPPAPQDHPRAPGRGAALRHLARRPPQRLDEAAAALPGEEEARRVLPGKLLSHGVGQLPHPEPARRHARDRRRPDPLLHRLAIREHRPRGEVVRRRADQRGRPPQDRARQRGTPLPH